MKGYGYKMKYRKAAEVFPDELLKEIQKYSSGELIYIPKTKAREDWGSSSGAKTFYTQRNSEIRSKHRHEKRSIPELAEEYNLSPETIRRIVYR